MISRLEPPDTGGQPTFQIIMSSLQTLGADRIPPTGFLLIPGRLGFQELLAVTKMFHDRPITWLIEESAKLDPMVRDFLERSGKAGASFAADDDAPTAVGEALKGKLADRGILVFVNAPTIARPGEPIHIQGKILKTLCSFKLPLLPLAVDYPREVTLSIDSSRPAAVLSFGNLIAASDASSAAYRENLLEASERAFSNRPFLAGSLAVAVLAGLKKHGSTCKLHDGSDDSVLGFDRLLGAAAALSKEIRKLTNKRRVGIILPPGKGGLVANVAVLFAGKIPVNFNFTASHEAVRSAIRQGDIDKFITADPFVRKVSAFPWPPNRDLIFIERLLPALKPKIIRWVIAAKILPTAVLAKLLGIGRRRNNDEAILLFTSGSSGEPKGVGLTHRNVLANVSQFGSRLSLPHGAKILASLPLFHSFGSTVTMFFPLIEGVDVVTYPSPLETKRLAELIAQHQVYILLATPTFLRGYMKRVDPEQLASLGLVVTGAEKLPVNLAQSFFERFGIYPQEGYGLTETSPATNVNLPEPQAQGDAPVLPTSRPGSVGQLLPGIAIRLTHAATEQPTPINTQGVIWFKGANIFPGYLNDVKKTDEVIRDGWFRTGDVGRVDDDGFLYIEGRISRFSKIAGEMVPHETIEAAVNKVLGLDQETERRVAVVGIPDVQKGEAIVLLSTIAGPAMEQECIDLRYKLMDSGMPSLWCPRHIIPVAEIPVLASGKLDIKRCEELARAEA